MMSCPTLVWMAKVMEKIPFRKSLICMLMIPWTLLPFLTLFSFITHRLMAEAMDGVIPGQAKTGTGWSSARPMASMGQTQGKSWFDPDEMDPNHATRIHRTVRVTLPREEKIITGAVLHPELKPLAAWKTWRHAARWQRATCGCLLSHP
jgi:hypothetical protein